MSYPLSGPASSRRATLVFLGAAGAFVFLAVLAAAVLTVVYVGHRPSGTTAVPSASSDDLRRYLLPAPAGSTALSSLPSADGRLDMDEAKTLSLLAPADELNLLSRYGFGRGAVGGWKTQDGTGVLIALLAFADSDDAIDYFAEEITAASSAFSAKDISMPDQPPAARILTMSSPDQDGVYSTYSYAVHGAVAIVVIINRFDAPVAVSEANRLLRQQYARM